MPRRGRRAAGRRRRRRAAAGKRRRRRRIGRRSRGGGLGFLFLCCFGRGRATYPDRQEMQGHVVILGQQQVQILHQQQYPNPPPVATAPMDAGTLQENQEALLEDVEEHLSLVTDPQQRQELEMLRNQILQQMKEFEASGHVYPSYPDGVPDLMGTTGMPVQSVSSNM